MKLLKKLSAKDILGNVLDVVKAMEIDETKEAFAMAGICSAYETGMSNYGEWVRFCGDLQGVNYLTGEASRAPKAHVPKVLEDLIMEGIADVAEIVDAKSTKTTKHYKFENAIEFSFKVSIKRLRDNEDGSVSYEYITEPMTEVVENDSIAHLTKLIEHTDAPAPAKKAPAKKAAAKK